MTIINQLDTMQYSYQQLANLSLSHTNNSFEPLNYLDHVFSISRSLLSDNIYHQLARIFQNTYSFSELHKVDPNHFLHTLLYLNNSIGTNLLALEAIKLETAKIKALNSEHLKSIRIEDIYENKIPSLLERTINLQPHLSLLKTNYDFSNSATPIENSHHLIVFKNQNRVRSKKISYEEFYTLSQFINGHSIISLIEDLEIEFNTDKEIQIELWVNMWINNGWLVYPNQPNYN